MPRETKKKKVSKLDTEIFELKRSIRLTETTRDQCSTPSIRDHYDKMIKFFSKKLDKLEKEVSEKSTLKKS
jgi:hypothetical protein